MAEVFVSHAGRDRAWAEWVGWQLEQAGVSVVLDFWDWRAGDNFVVRMNHALGSCTSMVALCSETYFEPARWTSQEWTAAIAIAKDRPHFLVPVRIDDAPVPPALRPLIAARLHGLPADQARAELIRALRPVGRPAVEPRFPGPAAGAVTSTVAAGGPRLPGALPQVWGGVPARNVGFIGRDGILVRLREGLSGSGRSVVQALNGAGGVGKTQLATEYAWQFANDYDAVWWVRAEQSELIGEQLAAFAVEWGLADPGEQVGPAVRALRRRCRGQGRWLLVLDNATSAHDVRDWVPAGPGHVLVTSRDPHWPEMATTVPVDVFARTESVTLLLAQVPTLDGDDAERLASALGDLPLALAQAAGVLAESGMSATEYLHVLRESAAEVLAEGRPCSYPVPLAAAVRIAMDRLTGEDEAAGQLLRLCANLAPEPIPCRWFTSAEAALPEPLATVVGKPLAFRRTLSRISHYGLAKISDDRVQMHRLTQAILRDNARPDDHTQRTHAVEAILGSADPGDNTDPIAWPAWAELLPHLRAVDLTGTGNTALRWQACEAAWYLLRRGDIHAGHDLVNQLYQMWRTRLGLDDRYTQVAAHHLADALRALGRHHEAHDLDTDTHDRCHRVLGPDHPNTLASANNLALDLRALGRHHEAHDLTITNLDRCRRVLGPDHPETLRSAHNLALDLRHLGRHHEAHDLNTDTHDRYRRILGPDHPDTLISANNLAANLRDLGRHHEAYDLDVETTSGTD